MVTFLAVVWILLASLGVIVSFLGARYSLSKVRELNRVGGYDDHHPMRVLATSHLRHHLARGVAFFTWIATGFLALISPRPDHVTVLLRVLLTVAVIAFVADSAADVRVRRRLSERYASRQYRSDMTATD